MPLREGANSSERLKVQGACATPASCQEAATVPRRDDSTCGLWQPLGLLLALPAGRLRPACVWLSPSRPWSGLSALRAPALALASSASDSCSCWTFHSASPAPGPWALQTKLTPWPR